MSAKLDEALKEAQIPSKLSPLEKQKIKKSLSIVKKAIDEIGERILEMDREQAYAAMRSLIDSVQRSSSSRKPLEHKQEDPQTQTPSVAPKREKVAGKKKSVAEMDELIKALPPELQQRAEKLECIEQMRDEAIGSDAICPECDGEKLLSCIKTFDTGIRVDGGEPSRQE